MLPTLSQIKSLLQKIARENGIKTQAKETWEHSSCVWNFSKKIAKLATKNGYRVDLKFLKLACFIHDLGRAQTDSKATSQLLDPVRHGYLGYKLALRHGVPRKLAETCRRHTGGTGLSEDVNRKFKMGRRSTFARTIEEKILGYADVRTFHHKIAPFQKAYYRFKKYEGQGKRLIALQKFIRKITNDKIS